MKGKPSWTRRLAIKNAMAVAGIVGAARFLVPGKADAQDLPQVTADDPTAQALEYTHDASSSSARKNSNEFCNNCIYYKGSSGDAWAPCDLFPGKAVAGAGWCNVWTAKG